MYTWAEQDGENIETGDTKRGSSGNKLQHPQTFWGGSSSEEEAAVSPRKAREKIKVPQTPDEGKGVSRGKGREGEPEKTLLGEGLPGQTGAVMPGEKGAVLHSAELKLKKKTKQKTDAREIVGAADAKKAKNGLSKDGPDPLGGKGGQKHKGKRKSRDAGTRGEMEDDLDAGRVGEGETEEDDYVCIYVCMYVCMYVCTLNSKRAALCMFVRA